MHAYYWVELVWGCVLLLDWNYLTGFRSWCGGMSCSWTGTTSPGSGGADLGAVPVAEVMDNL